MSILDELFVNEKPASTDIDRKCRKLIMSAYLYYNRSCSMITDSEYDDLSRDISDQYNELTKKWKWSFVDQNMMRDTGIGFRISDMAASAAVRAAHERGDILVPPPKLTRFRYSGGTSERLETTFDYEFEKETSPFGYRYILVGG